MSDPASQPPASVVRGFVPWFMAACFAIAAARLGQLYLSSRTETALLQQQQELTQVAVQAARNQLEAEQLITSRQIAELEKKVAEGARQLAELQTRAQGTSGQLTSAQAQAAAGERTLAGLRAELKIRDEQLLTLAQRIEALNDAVDESARAQAGAKAAPAASEPAAAGK